MINTRRITFIAAFLGAGVFAVTFLGAAKQGESEKGPPPREPGKATGTTENGSGLVCLGTVDSEPRPIQLLPKIFPTPAEVTDVLVKDGQKVTANQDLLKMSIVADKTLSELKVAEAKAAVTEAEAL